MKKITVAPKKTAKKTTSKAGAKITEHVYEMPKEVAAWISDAQSRINFMKSEIDRLKEENKNLKSYKKFAEHKILRSEAE